MRIFILALIISGIFSIAKSACGKGSMQCQDGHCVINGSGRINLIGNQTIKTLTLAAGSNECNTAIAISANANITIETLIIDRNKANIVGSGELIFIVGVAGSANIIIGNVKKGTSAGTNPSDISFRNPIQATIINKDNTDNIKITLPSGEVIQAQGNSTANTVTQIVSNYAQALNEQLNLESANTMILYNILNNYDGTYINYDYGFGNQVGIGAFNNGGFFRYYNKDSANGFDVGAKYKIQVANKLYLRGAVYYMSFASTHSIIAGMGLLKELDLRLDKNGKVFFVLNPSANIYYATTLKGQYMPANHLGFFNAGLETGLRIKKTSLLIKGSYGYALNSLKSISVDLGNNIKYTNTTAFYSKVYHASFGISQKLGRVALKGEAGAVFLDDKPHLKLGAMLNIIFGKNTQNNDTKGTNKTNKAQSSKSKSVKSGKDSKTSAQKRESTPNTNANNTTPKTTTNRKKNTTPTRVPPRPINARETTQASTRANVRTNAQRTAPSTKPDNTKARQTPQRHNPRQASQLPQKSN